MSINVTLSDKSQQNTIAFSSVAFITGSAMADSFFPPGKVADLWGFQYLRDNDADGMGHSMGFLTKIANNVFSMLDDSQLASLIAMADSQVDKIATYGMMRFPLMQAFRDLLEGNGPTGNSGLDSAAIKNYSLQLYLLDGTIGLQRAQVLGDIIHSLNDSQQSYLDAMGASGFLGWPDVDEQLDAHALGLQHDEHVAVTTYLGALYSWYVGTIESDTYFAPERQGTYFGGFYLKDAPAVGNDTYIIDAELTGSMGEQALALLSSEQAALLTNCVDEQRDALLEIVDTRRQVATELRKAMLGETIDQDQVMALMATYGNLDGEIVHRYATRFAALADTLSDEQKQSFDDFRTEALGPLSFPSTAYLYSDPITLPDRQDVSHLFTTS